LAYLNNAVIYDLCRLMILRTVSLEYAYILTMNNRTFHMQALAQCRTVLNDLGVDKVRDQDTAVAAKVY
jgi:hypothetical protein